MSCNAVKVLTVFLVSFGRFSGDLMRFEALLKLSLNRPKDKKDSQAAFITFQYIFSTYSCSPCSPLTLATCRGGLTADFIMAVFENAESRRL